MWILYQLAYGLMLLLAGPFLLFKRGGHYLASLPRRLTLGAKKAVPTAPIWLHAVSVGEVGVAATLASALPDEPLLVTTITPTGQARAASLFDGRATVDYLPFDLGWPVRRFLRHFSPRALILTEGDYWPLLLHHVRRSTIPVAVVNGRVGDRSFARMQRLKGLLGPLLGSVAAFGVQTTDDRRRLLELGVASNRVWVTGNLKFEADEPARLPELEDLLLEVAAERPILVAGSTMAGEESLVLDAFADLGAAQEALLVLAPRHPERWDEVERLVREREPGLARRSRLERRDRPSVVLLDSMGELASIYRLATAAFIGGTLVPSGGHNPLEPARFGLPVAVGPSMENFRAMAEQFDRAEAWHRVATADDLAHVWRLWLEEPDAAATVGRAASALVESNRGSLASTIEMLSTQIWPERPDPSRPPSTGARP